MSLVFNMVGGDGADDTYAFIVVTYPAGSTCTASDGTTTLTAPDTSGSWVIKIPTPASLPEAWTVSCTDGTRTASTAVTITTEGQSESVSLAYLINLYMDGVDNTAVTGGWEAYGGVASGRFHKYDTYMELNARGATDPCSAIYTENKIDLTSFSTLHYLAWASGSTDDPPGWRCIVTNSHVTSRTPGAEVVAQKKLPTQTGVTDVIDVSALSGSYYIGFNAPYSNGTDNRTRVYQVWLD